jgi:hypothetical protein
LAGALAGALGVPATRGLTHERDLAFRRPAARPMKGPQAGTFRVDAG